jgi:IclR family transcriptional regulator, pca regulon regulatory protein
LYFSLMCANIAKSRLAAVEKKMPSSRKHGEDSAANKAGHADFTQHEGNPDFVLSLARGLRVIETFEGHTDGQSVADVARRTGLSRAAVRRSLMTLQIIGYAESNGAIYRLTTRVLRLGFSYLSSASLPALAQPVIERITELVHESSSLSVLDGDEIVYIARSTSKRVMSVGLSVGSRLPAYCTSMGRILLAALPDEQLSTHLQRTEVKALTPKTITDKELLREIVVRIRSDSFAITDEELELGLRSIAVPVCARDGRVIAAMNIGVHAARVSAAEMIHRFLPILQENAHALGQVLA